MCVIKKQSTRGGCMIYVCECKSKSFHGTQFEVLQRTPSIAVIYIRDRAFPEVSEAEKQQSQIYINDIT